MHLHSRSRLPAYYYSTLNKVKYATLIWIESTLSHHFLICIVYFYRKRICGFTVIY